MGLHNEGEQPGKVVLFPDGAVVRSNILNRENVGRKNVVLLAS